MIRSILILAVLTFCCHSFLNAQQRIVDNTTSSGSASYIVAEPDDSKLVFRGSGTTFYFVNLEDLSIRSETYAAFTEEEKAGNVIFGRGTLTTELTDLTFVNPSDAFHLDYYSNENWPRIFVQASGGAYFGSGRFDPDVAGRDVIRLSEDLTTVTRPFNLVEGNGVDLINKNIYHVQMTPFGDNKLLIKAKRTTTDEEYFVWDDTNNTLTQLTDIDNTQTDATYPINWPLAKAYGNKVVFFYNDQLFTSDGTSANTQLISSVSILDLEAIGGADDYVLYGSEDVGDTELYLYADGGAPTKLDLNTGGSSSPTDFVSNANLMMFIADDGSGYEPFISDGTIAGTKKLIDINDEGASMSPSAVYNIKTIVTAGEGFAFIANNGVYTQLYYTDGTNVVVLNNDDDYNGYASNLREALSTTSNYIYFSDLDGSIFSTAIPDNIYVDGQWSNNTPENDQSLYFDADYTFSSDLVIHSAHIPSGVTVTVPAGITLEITSILHDRGHITVETGGTLIYNEPINTLELQAMITKIEAFLTNSQSGSEPGQYPAEAINQLTDSLTKANTILTAANDIEAVELMAENLHQTLIDVRWQEVQEEFAYLNNIETIIGDLKQAQIRDLLTSKSQIDYLLLGMREARAEAVRINIFGTDLNPNEEMFDYFYEQAVARGFKVFANPAEWAGGQRIACETLNGERCTVKDDPVKTQILIDRVITFANQYKCDWINAFNEDGGPDVTWSSEQINQIYTALEGNVNGAELIGSCTWGIPAGINMLKETNMLDHITVSTTHNLGFHHNSWAEFISLSGDLPVWDSETNYNDKYETGTRVEVAVAAGVQGLVLYDYWRSINLSDGTLNGGGLTIRDTYSGPIVEATSLTLNGDNSVELSETITLTAEVLPENNTNKELTWSSDNEAVATVDSEGIVTGVSLGTANITATTTDGTGTSGSITITVSPLLVKTITIDGATQMIHGTSQTLSATVLPEAASDRTYTWSSSDNSIVSIDENGQVNALAVGNASVIATANDGSGTTGNFNLTVSPLLVASIIITGNAEITEGETLQLAASIAPDNATDASVAWSVDDETVATISATGLLTATTPGTVTVTATANDASGISTTADVVINEKIVAGVDQSASISIYPNPTKNHINILTSVNQGVIEYQLVNLSGKIVDEQKIIANNPSIDVSRLKRGVYILTVKTSGQESTHRIILE